MNLPNRLTLMRILLIPLILLFLLPMPDLAFWADWNRFLPDQGRLIAFLLFGIAALTDLIDGRIARKQNLVTTLGKFLDPIADKMLVISVLIALVQIGRVHALITIIVIIREFVITGVRLIAAEHGIVIAAGRMGKIKTVSQIVAILIILAESLISRLTGINPAWISGIGDAVLLVSVALTLISGTQYLIVNRALLKG